MITQFKEYNEDKPSQDQELIDRTIQEYLGSGYERRMVIFENYWNTSFYNQFSTQSVKPYLSNVGNLINEKVTTLHRYISSKEDLIYYLKSPGVMFDHLESYGVSLWYFGVHGMNNGLEFPEEIMTHDDILETMDGVFMDFPNILYFPSCSLFEDKDFGYQLLESTGTRGILGFTKEVPFSLGTIVDLLWCLSFFIYNEGDPFKNLDRIYDYVIRTFPVSKKLGFTLFC